MNKKGFAITTVIYGLTVLGLMIIVILMGLLSSTRNNVSSEAKRIEEELIAYNLASKNYTCTAGTNLSHRVPKGESGWYRVEAFGGPNGNAKGAYTTGIIYLPENLELNICEGDKPVISVNNGATKKILMKPIETTPSGSGTLARYNGESIGAKFDWITFKLTGGSNVIGSNGVTYNSSDKSIISGYPSGVDVSSPVIKSVNGVNVPLYFVDGLMLPNVNESAPRVHITKLADDTNAREDRYELHANRIPGRNEKYNGKRYVKVEIKAPTGVSLASVSASYQGKIKRQTCGMSAGTCRLNLGGDVNIDDISVLFSGGSYGKDIGGASSSYIKITLSSSSGAEQDIYTSQGSVVSNGEKMTTITPTGIKMSAYQPDWIEENLPSHGNYYIFPVNSESRVWSARESAETDSNPVIAEYLTGEARQKWSIDILSIPKEKNKTPREKCAEDNTKPGYLFANIPNHSCNTEYRIMELTRYKSIAIYKDENIRRNAIAAPETFQALSRNEPQIWNIKTMNDGTFAIKTVITSSNPEAKAGFLTADTNEDGSETHPIRIMIGQAYNGADSTVADYNTTQTAIERVRIYAVDFVR